MTVEHSFQDSPLPLGEGPGVRAGVTAGAAISPHPNPLRAPTGGWSGEGTGLWRILWHRSLPATLLGMFGLAAYVSWPECDDAGGPLAGAPGFRAVHAAGRTLRIVQIARVCLPLFTRLYCATRFGDT